MIVTLAALTLFACHRAPPAYHRATVSITNLAQNSGGSGTIVSSSPGLSVVLTNAHVCEVAKNGGLVNTDDGKSYPIQGYKQSATHDLCLAAVNADLKVSAKLSPTAPQFMDSSTVSGHPHLLPTIVTHGHVSGKKLIQLIVGIKECTKEDFESAPLICLLAGGLPIIKTFDSQITSNLIQPGSSGSGVFNIRGELIAVVFAGSGDLGFNFAVPYEFVKAFLEVESGTLAVQIVNYTQSLIPSAPSRSRHDYNRAFKEACTEVRKQGQKSEVCDKLYGLTDISDLISR